MNASGKSGFTLVELAIVLVIIGLIIGGVLAGQTLIRNAEIRSIISEKDEFEAAITTFRSRYNALPGDKRDATRYWGAQDADHATCIALTTPSLDGSTCNGNGDKMIAHGNTPYEQWRAWQHLGNAELVPFSGSGVQGPTSQFDSEIGVNIPESGTFSGTGWRVGWIGNITDSSKLLNPPMEDAFFNASYGHAFLMGNPSSTIPGLGSMPSRGVLTPNEAKALDDKIDDGWPGKGVFRVFSPVSSTHAAAALFENDCATDTDPTTAEYNIFATDTDLECTLLFITKI